MTSTPPTAVSPHPAAPAAVVVQDRGELVGVLHRCPVRDRQPELGEPGAHLQLVLSVEQGVGAGVHGDAARDQLAQDRRWDVLVVEGDHVHRLGEGEHGVQVAVVADAGRGEVSAHALRLLEHGDLDAQFDRRRDHHPGQLTAADHANSVPGHRLCFSSILFTVPAGNSQTRGPALA